VSDTRTSTDLTRIRPAWLVVLPVCALLLSLAITFAVVLMLSAARFNTAQGPINGALTWRETILWSVGGIGVALWVCWEILKQALTRFTPEGITQPRLLGRVHIPWSSVDWVSPGVTIGSATQRIPVSPHAFRDPEMVMQAIKERIPEQTPMVEQPSFGSWLIGRVKRS
jgi:hypothetical protein